MTSVELLEQQLREFREESDAAVQIHRTHMDRQNSATVKEGHDLLRKLKLAQRDERRDVKQDMLQDTPLTSRIPPLGSSVQGAAIGNYREVMRKRKATNDYDAAAIAVGSTDAFHAPTGMSLAQYRMAQQQQMVMYQQAMQQQNMAILQWMGAHSAPSYTPPSQNAWANFGAGNQSNFNAQYAAQSRQQNQLHAMSRTETAGLYGYPPIPQSGSATPVTTKGSIRYDARSTKTFAPMDSHMLQYSAGNALPQQHHTKGNAPTSDVEDVLSNEDAAAILALVENENERSASAVIATPSTNAASRNNAYCMPHNTGPSPARWPLGVPDNYGTMTTVPQAMGSGQQNKPAPDASWSYY